MAALGDDSYEDGVTCFDEDDLTCRERGKGQPFQISADFCLFSAHAATILIRGER